VIGAQVAKAVRRLAENPRHSNLNTHEWDSLEHPVDPQAKACEVYARKTRRARTASSGATGPRRMRWPSSPSPSIPDQLRGHWGTSSESTSIATDGPMGNFTLSDVSSQVWNGLYAPDPFRSRYFPVDSAHLRTQVGRSPATPIRRPALAFGAPGFGVTVLHRHWRRAELQAIRATSRFGRW